MALPDCEEQTDAKANFTGYTIPLMKKPISTESTCFPVPWRRLGLLWALLLPGLLAAAPAGDTPPTVPPPADKTNQATVRIAQLVPGQAMRRHYPDALPSLLQYIGETTTLKVVPEPVILDSFEDKRLFEFPFVYVNFADRQEWKFSELECRQLRDYLERGGFIFVDAGINAEFLRDNPELGQRHSFAEWEATPELKEAFAAVFPEKRFQVLKRSHPLFRSFFEGLPDSSTLPDSVRDYVVKEKWPEGTYSAVGLEVKGRLAVLATPIIAMGWGRNPLGNWTTTIRFRVLEETTGLSDYLKTAAYSGARFEVAREDGGKDIVYCQEHALPAWAQEPGNRWRVFRYYGSREISDFAHVYYTRLATNILMYAMTH